MKISVLYPDEVDIFNFLKQWDLDNFLTMQLKEKQKNGLTTFSHKLWFGHINLFVMVSADREIRIRTEGEREGPLLKKSGVLQLLFKEFTLIKQEQRGWAAKATL